MPVAIQMPQRQKAPIDAFNDALGAIDRVYQMKLASAKNQKEEDELNRQRNGILSNKEALEYSEKYKTSDTETPGAFKFNVNGKDVYYSPKDSNKPAPISQLEHAKLLGEGFKQVQEGTPGAVPVSFIGADGAVNRSILLPPSKKDKDASFTQKDVMNIGNELRKERNGLPLTKSTQEITQAYSRMQGFDDSPAGDMGLIYSFNKIMDPGSTVREGEFANAQNAAGVPDRLRNLYNKVIQGTRLTPEQRADFLKQSEQLAARQIQQQQEADTQYIQLAKKYGIPKEQVIVDFKLPSKRENAAQGASPLIPGGIVKDANAGVQNMPTADDLAAHKWAKENPQDKRAAAILARTSQLGLK